MNEERSLPVWLLPGVALLLVALALLWISRGPKVEPIEPAAPRGSFLSAPAPVAPEHQVALAPEEMPPTSAEAMAIRPGETLELSRASLPRRGSISLGLLLPFEVASTQRLPMRVLSPDRRIVEGEGRPDPSQRGRIEIEIEAAFLEPGRYVIEMKTPERTHFPARRYALQINAE